MTFILPNISCLLSKPYVQAKTRNSRPCFGLRRAPEKLPLGTLLCYRFAFPESSACRCLKEERRGHRRSCAVDPGRKELSQGDIEKRTGLLRCYISRVENGHTVPTVETLEKMARALEVPFYRLFYDGEAPPKLENLPKRKSADDIVWGSSGKDARYVSNLRRLLARARERDRKLLLSFAQKLASKRNGQKSNAA
jgi:transcriptional regulator with XRE-family HTH domain